MYFILLLLLFAVCCCCCCFWAGRMLSRIIIGNVYRHRPVVLHCSAASRFGVFNRTTLIDFHFASRFVATWRWSNAILDFGSHGHECLFNVSCIFGGCLKEWNAQLIGIFLIWKEWNKKHNKLKTKNSWGKRDKMFPNAHTIAVVWSTTFFVVKSHLFPTSSLFTFSHA